MLNHRSRYHVVILPRGNNDSNSDSEKNVPKRTIEYKKTNNEPILFLVVRITTAIFCMDVPVTLNSSFTIPFFLQLEQT